MSISVEFQQRMQELFAECDKNKKTQVAKEIGIDYRSFSSALNYGIIPKPMVLAKIADYFSISIPYLLGRSENDSFEIAKTKDSFHNRLNLLKEERKITYYKIAQHCHFDKSCISKWLKKNHIPTLEILDLLADYFKVSIDYLLGRTDDRD